MKVRPQAMAPSACFSNLTDREAAAYHEAGHAVAAHHLGQPGDILNVHIVATQLSSGRIELASIPHTLRNSPECETRVRNRLTVLMAGRAAEEKATGEERPGSARLDINEAFPLYLDAGFGDGRGTPAADRTIDQQNDQSLYTEWLEEARRFMNEPDRWAEVQAVKDELLRRCRLSGEEVSRVIRGVGRKR